LALATTLILLSTLAGCRGNSSTEPAGEAIAIDALPDGPGRGFAEIVVLTSDRRGPRVGEPAPAFRMQLVDGRYVELDDLQGRPVLINFWATWCPPCRREMPDIIAASESNDDLVVLAVNVQEELKVVGPFVSDFDISMPVLRDIDGELRQTYGVSGMPTSVFIDRDGNVSAVWSGLLTAETLDDLLNEIL
jgi:thiol-disulfide isomerase/thioredoxin